MKKQRNWLFFSSIVIVTALVFAGWRMYTMTKLYDRSWSELEGGVYENPVMKSGLKHLVPPDEIYASGLTAADRPALVNPKYSDIASADAKLADDLEGIAVSVGGTHRFYPFQILNWHQIVRDDDVNGQPLIITYSPLTGSAVVYSAWVGGEANGDRHNFEDAGLVYNNGLLLQDGYGTLWHQTTGQAIVGKQVGQKLDVYPSVVMTWASWKTQYPSGLALSTETGYPRDYGRHPYASYETSPAIFFPVNHILPTVGPKDIVYRVDHDDATLVFMRNFIPFQSDPNASLGDADLALEVAGFYDPELKTVRVFDRKTTDLTLTFNYTDGTITDVETGSRWSPEGVALSGKLRGTALTEIPVTRHYAFAHFAMYPNSIVSGFELLPVPDSIDEGQVIEIK